MHTICNINIEIEESIEKVAILHKWETNVVPPHLQRLSMKSLP